MTNTTTRRNRVAEGCGRVLVLWLTAACVAGGHVQPAPRSLKGPQGLWRGAAGAGAVRQVDRSLHIRSIPALKGYNSNLFQVFMGPYHFEVPALTAVAALMPASGVEGGPSGALTLWQPHPPLGPLIVAGNLTGLPAGAKLLLQVKRWGDMREGCDGATGPPFDPFGPSLFPSAVPVPGGVGGGMPAPAPAPAPAPMPPRRYLGDVGVVEASGDDGSTMVHLVNHALALTGSHGILGRALALRMMPAATGTDAADAATDNMESIACGVIAMTRYEPLPPPPPPPTPPPPPKNPDAELVEPENLRSRP